jgi:hypothetical protein
MVDGVSKEDAATGGFVFSLHDTITPERWLTPSPRSLCGDILIRREGHFLTCRRIAA